MNNRVPYQRIRRDLNARYFRAWSVAGWLLLFAACLAAFGAVPARAETPLTSLEYRIVGLELRPVRTQLAIPKGIPGALTVQVVGVDGTQNEVTRQLAAGAVVEATLRGPSFAARRVIGQPNDDLLFPPLNLVGDYQLDELRLVDAVTGAVRLEGTPSSIPIHVFEEVLVSSVTSRPLTLEEIQDKGIVIDERNFRAVEFEVGFVVDGQTIPVRFPVVSPRFTESTEIIPLSELEAMLAEAERINNGLALTAELPPELEASGLNIQIQGINFQFVDPGGDTDLALRVPPIPALMVIPGRIGFLNQFFSVQIFTENAAPGDSGLLVKSIRATLELPPGQDRVPGTFDQPGDDPLRFARVGPNAVIQPVQPVVNPGADGRLGTPDDLGRLHPGETGQAEFLVEGLREGLHVMDIQLDALLEGLGARLIPIRGTTSGSVLVRNPSFSLAFSHPRTIRTGEPYTASVTILNTSRSPANLVSVTLPETSLSGAVFDTGQADTVQLGTILPGETATAEFRLRAQRTGSITFSQLTGDSDIEGRFQLRMGIDERGVALSPDAIGYPDFVTDLDAIVPEVFAAANRVLGQALSVATAPQLPPGVQGLSKAAITRRVIELAEAGQRLRYGDGVERVLADLLLDWQGGRGESAGFDQILRATNAGREFREALMRALEQAESGGASDRLAARAVDLAGRGEAWFLTAGDAAGLESAMRLGDAEAGLDRSAIEHAAGYRGTAGHWLVSRHGPGALFRWDATVAIPAADILFLELRGDGTGRQLRWSIAGAPAGACFHYTPDPANASLEVDHDCDGAAEASLIGAETAVLERPPQVIAVLQDTSVVAGRPVNTCTGPDYRNYGTVLAVLFSKPMDQQSVDLPGAYVLNDGNLANSVQIQPGGRVALINLQRGVGTIRPRSLEISGVTDPRGNTLATTSLPVQATAGEGVAVRGRVARAGGEPAVGVPVTLTMYETVPSGYGGCVVFTVRASQVFTDPAGGFSLDFVIAGVPYSVSATDTTGLSAEAVALILDSVSGDAFDRAKLIDLANQPNAKGTLLAEFAVGALPEAIAVAEGLDRALLRDLVDLNSPRVGTEVPFALRFRGRGAVTGTVLASDGAPPVAGVAVNLFPDPDSRELGRGVFSDSGGRFAFFGVPLGTYTIEASSPAGLQRTVTGVIQTPGQIDDIDVVLSASVVERTNLRGIVFENDGITGHASARVFVGHFWYGKFVDVVAMTTTDGNGFWDASEIPVGTWDLVAVSSDGRRKGERLDVAASAGITNHVNITLQGRTTVFGRVEFANGAPAANAIVAGGDALVRTDANGVFTLTGVPTGQRTISAGLERNPAAGIDFTRLGSASLEVLPGVSNFVVIRLDPAGRIVGRVLDERGTPVPGVRVVIPQEGGFLWTEADTNGNYRFEHLPLDSYTVSAPGGPVANTDVSGVLDTLRDRSASQEEILAAIGEAFEVFTGVNDPFLTGEGLSFNPLSWGFSRTALDFDGQTAVADVQFLPVGTISGKVLNGRGVPIGARVRLTGVGPTTNGDVGFGIRGEQNSDPALGTFEFSGQALVGDFGLQAASPFFPAPISLSGRTTTVDTDATGLVLQFPAEVSTNGRLAGTVLGPDGAPAGAGVEVRISFGDLTIRTNDQGRFDTQIDLPAINAEGRPIGYTIEAKDPGTGLRGRTFAALTPGQTTEATVRLLGRGGLIVQVLQANSQPAVGAQVTVNQGTFPFDRFTGATDAHGTLALGNLFEGSYAVDACLVSGPTTICGRAGVHVSSGQTASVSVSLKPTATIRGTFVERDLTTPVTFAHVAIGTLGFATTDGTGAFEVGGIPLGTYRIVAQDPVNGRRAIATVTLSQEGEVQNVTLVEQALGDVEGAVISGFGNSFVPGASVTLRILDGLTPERTVTTDPGGFFHFPGTPAGSFTLSALDPATGLRGNVSGALPENLAILRIDVPLQPLTNVTCIVLRPDGTTPAANATVTLKAVGVHSRSIDTDTAGRVQFTGVALGTYTLRAASRNPGETRSVAEIKRTFSTQGVSPDFTITLGGVGSVSGRVLASNGSTPVSGTEVRLFIDAGFLHGDTESVITDTEGRFGFDNVAVGAYRLSARAQALAAIFNSEIAFDGEVHDVELVLGPSGTVVGRLVRADGVTPVVDIDVVLSFTPPSGLLGRAVARTDAGGRFDLTGIPVGAYALEAIAPDIHGIARLSGALTTNAEILDLGDVALDQEYPAVAAVLPAHTARDVAIDAMVLLTFSEALDPSMIDPKAFILRSEQGTVARTVELLSDPTTGLLRLVRIAPNAPLSSETTYEVIVVSGDVRDATGVVTGRGPVDLVGRPLARPFTSQFTTADQDPPDLVSFTPADGAIQVDPSSVVRLSFDEPIRTDGLSIAVDGSGGQVAGSVAVGLNGLVLVFTPATFLDANAVYSVTVNGVRDLAGNPAGGQPFVSRFATTDTLGPTIGELRIHGTPAAGSTLNIEAVLLTQESGARVRMSADFVPFGETDPNAFTLPLALPGHGTVVVRAIAIDRFGNQGPVAELPLTVIENAPPQVTFTRISPATGPVKSGSAFIVDVSATDDSGVTELRALAGGAVTVPLKVTAGALIRVQGVVPSGAVPGSLLKVFAQATDTSGASTGQQALDITVSDGTPPTVTIIEPAAGTTVRPGDDVTVRISASDLGAIGQVSYSAAGATATADTRVFDPAQSPAEATFVFTVPAAATGNDVLQITGQATDGAGNRGQTTALTVRIADIQPPQVTLRTQTGATRFQADDSVTVIVDATDEVGVAEIGFDLAGFGGGGTRVAVAPPSTSVTRSFTFTIPAGASVGETAHVTGLAKDVTGNAALSAGLTLSIADLTPPTVSVLTPSGGAEVVPGETVQVQVQETDNIGATELTLSTSGAVVSQQAFNVDPPQGSLTHTFDLPIPGNAPSGAAILLTAGARDAAGNQGTAQVVTVRVADLVPPAVVSVNPADGAVDVDPATVVTVTFNEPVAGEMVHAGTMILAGPDGPVSGSYTFSNGNRTVVFRPAVPLTFGGAHTLTLTTGITDLSGNGLTAPFTLRFTTRPPDTTPPRVIGIVPQDGTVDVSIAAAIQVMFTEPVDPATVNAASFSVTAGAAGVAGRFSFRNNNTAASFTPDTPLPLATVITVHLTAAIADPSGNALADASGNPLTQPLTITFTTGSFAITSPANGSDVTEKTKITLEAKGSASLNIATVTFTVNGQALPAVSGPPFITFLTTPAMAAVPTLTIVATAYTGSGTQAAQDQAVVNLVPGLRVDPSVLGVPLGGTGTLRLSVTSALTEDISVNLSPVQPEVVTLPTNPVVLPAGQTEVVVAMTGAVVGSTTLLAQSSHGTAAAIISVSEPIPQQQLLAFAPPVGAVVTQPPSLGAVIVGVSGQQTVSVPLLSAPAIGDTQVIVTSSDPAVGAVVGTPVIAAGSQVVTLTIQTGSQGVATLTLSAGGEMRQLTVIVGTPPAGKIPLIVAPPVGAVVTQPPSLGAVIVGISGQQTMSMPLLSAPAIGDRQVIVTSSDPAVAAVVGTPVIAAGSQVVTLTIQTGSQGVATLTLSAGGEMRQLTVIVGTPPAGNIPLIVAPPVGAVVTQPPSLGAVIVGISGQQTVGVLLLSAPAIGDRQVIVTSSDPAVAAVVGTPVIAAGSQVVTLTIQTGSQGVATLTLSAGGEMRQLTVIVGTPPAGKIPLIVAPPVGAVVTQPPSLGAVIVGISGQQTMSMPLLSAPAIGDTQVIVTISDPAVGAVVGTPVIAAGSQVVTLTIQTGSQGVATLTLSAGGEMRQLTVIVGTPPAGLIPLILAAPVEVEVQ